MANSRYGIGIGIFAGPAAKGKGRVDFVVLRRGNPPVRVDLIDLRISIARDGYQLNILCLRVDGGDNHHV